MERRGFFAALAAPFVARLLPAPPLRSVLQHPTKFCTLDGRPWNGPPSQVFCASISISELLARQGPNLPFDRQVARMREQCAIDTRRHFDRAVREGRL